MAARRPEPAVLATIDDHNRRPQPPARERSTKKVTAAERRKACDAAAAAAPSAEQTAEEEAEMMELLRQHNKKFAVTKPTYEPRKHSVASMRAWEQRTGRRYHELSAEDRRAANEEINCFIANGAELCGFGAK